MLKKQINLNLIVQKVEVLLGITLIIKGIWLEADRSYFFYPPTLSNVMNNPYLDGFMILIGLALTITAIFNNHSKRMLNLIKVLLVISAIIWIFLALIQVTHGIFTPEYRMGHAALGDFFIFSIIVIVVSYV